MAVQLTDIELNNLKEALNIGWPKTGADLNAVLRAAGYRADDELINNIAKELQLQASEPLSLELTCAAAVKLPPKANVNKLFQDAFECMNKYGDGTITNADLRIIFENIAELRQDELDMIIEEADTQDAGRVYIEDIYSVFTSKEKCIPRDSEMVFQGAESRVYRHIWYGHKVVTKQRFVKGYLHPDLSKAFIKQRTRSEVRNILKCRAIGIDCPWVLSVRLHAGIIVMEDLGGTTVADVLKTNPPEPIINDIAQRLGNILAEVHDSATIVHGDLTTSNVILRNGCDFSKEVRLALIDFGLSSTSDNIEDRAVDLYVLERAIKSNHPQQAADFNAKWLQSYASRSPKCAQTLKRLETVRQRGRKRLAFG